MGEEPLEHEDCPRNYTSSSSKATEATAALDLVIQLYLDKKVGLEAMFSDNNSMMRTYLYHIGAYKGGKLSLSVPHPKSLCDPLHRNKVMGNEVFVLALSIKSKSKCEKIDALR